MGTGGCRQEAAKCSKEGCDDAVNTANDGRGFEGRDEGSGETLVFDKREDLLG